MIGGSRSLGLAAALAAALIAMLSASALAGGDAGDSISLANTAFTAANSGNITFKGAVDVILVTVACATSSLSGTTPAAGVWTNTGPPSFTGCHDSLGGTDSVTTNSMNGAWSMTFSDNLAEADPVSEPNTSDTITLNIAKAGAAFKSSPLSSRTITVAPNGPAPISSGCHESNTAAFAGQSVPAGGSGCATSSSATFNGSHVTGTTITYGS